MFGISRGENPVRALGLALLLSILGSAAALAAAILLFRHAGPASRDVSSHPVRSGETLAAISEKHYGDASLWPRLARFNGLSGTERLRVGSKLAVPVKGLFLYAHWWQSALLICVGALATAVVAGASTAGPGTRAEKAVISAGAFAGSLSALLAGTMSAGTVLVLGWGGPGVLGCVMLGLLGGVVAPAVVFHAAGAGAGRSVAAATVVATAAAAGFLVFVGTSVLYLP